MVDIEQELREYGARIDAAFDPIGSSEVFLRAESSVPEAVEADLTSRLWHGWSPVKILLVSAAAVLMLLLPIVFLNLTAPQADNVDPTVVVPPSQPVTPTTSVPPVTVPEVGVDLVLYTDDEDGWEMLLPQDWVGSTTEIPPGSPDPARFGVGPGDGPALIVWVGEPDGSITFCDKSLLFRDCSEVSVSSLDDFAQALTPLPDFLCETRPDGFCAGTIEAGEVILSGSPGRYERPKRILNNCLGCPLVWYNLFTIHEGRPVLLAFDYWTYAFEDLGASTEEIFDQMIASFRFLDDDPDSTTSTVPASLDLIPYADSVNGWEMDIPESWIRTTTGPDGEYQEPYADSEVDRYPGSRRFGDGRGFGGGPALTVTVGEADGSIRICAQSYEFSLCPNVEVVTIDDFAEAVVTIPDYLCDERPDGYCDDHIEVGEITLGEVSGRFERPARMSGFCLGCASVRYNVFTVQEGRPVLLAFDYWTLAFDALGPSTEEIVDQMIASFHLSD